MNKYSIAFMLPRIEVSFKCASEFLFFFVPFLLGKKWQDIMWDMAYNKKNPKARQLSPILTEWKRYKKEQEFRCTFEGDFYSGQHECDRILIHLANLENIVNDAIKLKELKKEMRHHGKKEDTIHQS